MSNLIKRIFHKKRHKYTTNFFANLVDVITPQDIQDNKLLCQRMISHQWDTPPKTFMFFNIYLLDFLAGGYKTHMDLVSYIYTHLNATIYMCFVPDITEQQKAKYVQELHKYYPDLKLNIVSVQQAHQISTDVCISIGLATAEAIKYKRCTEKYLHAMDNEALFTPAGTTSAVFDFLYSQGFFVFTNSDALKEVYSQKNPCTPVFRYVPGIDTRYHPANNTAKDKAVRNIIVYARPATPRNAFSLIVPALQKLKGEFGSAININLVGQDFDVDQYGLAGVCNNLGKLGSLDALAELYRDSDIGISMITTPTFSYLHLQLMASGVCLVTNDQPGIRNFLVDGQNAVVVPPVPNIISSRIADLLRNPEQMEQIAKNGNTTVKNFTWDSCFTSIINFIVQPKVMRENP